MNRRTFVYNSSLLAVAAGISRPVLAGTPKQLPAKGIQLYMVRQEMQQDTPGTLKQLGAMGYTQLESYGGDKGIFWGQTNREFRQLAAGYGLKLVSTHYNPCTLPEFERLAAQAAEIDMKYLICPWLGPQKNIDAFKHFADDFNARGTICKKHGLRFAYHPHDYPYKPVDGQLPIDVLLAHTDKHLVDFEMDVYYTVTEGKDPYTYIKNHSGRFRLMHMRDVLKKRLPAGSKEESACDLGEGIINYPRLISTAMANGMNYFFVEQSHYNHETPLQSAQKNAHFLERMRLV